jgi:hypothetical protein
VQVRALINVKLEEQVCTIDFAKQLRDLGVNKESLFNFCDEEDCPETYPNNDGYCPSCMLAGQIIHAYTVAELGAMLPRALMAGATKERRYLNISSGQPTLEKWYVYYDAYKMNDYRIGAESDTEADARAKMLIYLLGNKLMSMPPTEGATDID